MLFHWISLFSIILSPSSFINSIWGRVLYLSIALSISCAYIMCNCIAKSLFISAQMCYLIDAIHTVYIMGSFIREIVHFLMKCTRICLFPRKRWQENEAKKVRGIAGGQPLQNIFLGGRCSNKLWRCGYCRFLNVLKIDTKKRIKFQCAMES